MNISPLDAGIIDLVMRDDDHLVYYRNKPLLTSSGNEVKDENQRMLRQMIIECCLMNRITDEEICLFGLLTARTDFISSGKDPLHEQFDELCRLDPFVQLRQGSITAGEISQGNPLQSLPEHDPVLFNMLFWGISGALEAFSLFSLDYRETLLKGKKIADWNSFLLSVYSGLHDHQKAAVNLLSFTHCSGVILPVLFVCGYLSEREYTNSLSAIHLRLSGAFPVSPFAVPRCEPEPTGFLTRVPAYIHDCSCARVFIDSYKSLRLKGLAGIIGKGEGQDLEFKSTLRWDLKAGKTNQQVERACLKTISAFLNSNGGILLIGVRDDGSVEGIESDRFPNTDKFLLHLWTLIRTSFGTDVSPNILTKLEPAEGKTVCVVRCSRSGRPVFLRQPGFEEEFYVRVGPGTIALAVSEALKYISDHFSEK